MKAFSQVLLCLLLIFSKNSIAQKSITVGEYSTTIKDKRLALVIGNNEYKYLSKLHSPGFDAKYMKMALQACGFEVIYLEDGTKESIETSIDIFSKKLKSYDVGLIYYSGHGAEINGVTYLVPVDMISTSSLADIEYKCVKTKWPMEKMAEAGNENKTYIMILDACRNNPFLDITKSTVVGCWTKPQSTPVGSIICFAASNGEQASQGDSLSPYTQLMLKHMKTPGLNLEGVFKKVRIDLTEMRKLNPKLNMVPVEENKLTTEFYFVPAREGENPEPDTKPGNVNTELATLKIFSTADGTIKIDGVQKGSIKANDVKIYDLKPGNYIVQLITDGDNVSFNKEVNLTAAKTEILNFEIPNKTESNKQETTSVVENGRIIKVNGQNIEFYPEDLGLMSWQDAEKACEKLGDGWRLPTTREIVEFWDICYKNKKKYFKEGWYYDNDGNYTILEYWRYGNVGKNSAYPNIPQKAYVLPARSK
jgi:hypothetical protein